MLIINKTAKCAHVVALPGCACCRTGVRAVSARVGADLSRRGFVGGASVALLGLAAYSGPVHAQAAAAERLVIHNVRLFDGVNLNTRDGVTVVVDGKMIVDVVQGEIGATDGATVIDGGGRTLIPGLIDAHWHTMLAAMPLGQTLTLDVGDIHIAAVSQAHRTLMRGFTSVRDMGGPAFALKRAIDAGIAPGPRIYPSGALISQTSGHGDFRHI